RDYLSSTASSTASDHQLRDIMRWVTSQLTADGTALVKECNLSRWVRWARLSVNCCRISTMTHYRKTLAYCTFEQYSSCQRHAVCACDNRFCRKVAFSRVWQSVSR